MLTVRETQEIELGIMKKIHEYCEKHKLTYCMAYGTLLGAVRHRGFIPWDNDMDIIMPRPDYELLLKLEKEEPIGEDLECVHYTNDDKYHYQVIRICDMRTIACPTYIREQPRKMGVWVDIFPADGVPKSWRDQPLTQIKLWINKKLQLADIYSTDNPKEEKISFKKWVSNRKRNIAHFLFPGKNNIHAYKIDKYAASFKYADYDRVADIIERQPPNWLTHLDFNKRVLIDFEDSRFYAPADWDGYLKRYFGNYKELPPEDQREPHDINPEYRESTYQRDRYK